MTTEEEIAWCENIWHMLRHGGVWGIPRSGLLFQKQSTRSAFVLVERMPHMEGMPITAEQLREAQDEEIAALRERFEHLGIEVTDATV